MGCWVGSLVRRAVSAKKRALAGGISALAQLIELNEEVMDRLGQVVNLVLQLLHIPMRLIILARLLLVTAVELLLELVLRVLDLIVHLLDDVIHVLSLADLAEDVALELKHGLLDNTVVEVDHVGGDLGAELRVFIHDGLQVLLAKAVSINMMQSLVEEFRLVAEEVFVTANDGLLA